MQLLHRRYLYNIICKNKKQVAVIFQRLDTPVHTLVISYSKKYVGLVYIILTRMGKVVEVKILSSPLLPLYLQELFIAI